MLVIMLVEKDHVGGKGSCGEKDHVGGKGPEMAAAQRAAATNGPGPDLGPGPDPGSGSGPDPPGETMMGVSSLPTKNDHDTDF